MSDWGALFWSGVALACLIWYSTVTVLVAYRGAADIRGMLTRLREDPLAERQENDSASPPRA